MDEHQQRVVDLLVQRGAEIDKIAQITYDLQKSYNPQLTKEMCIENVYAVLKKREVQATILTGVELDMLAEQGKLSEPLSTMLTSDYGLYGIDEILALSIVNVYGFIGLTNFGYVDKLKPGLIKELDDRGKQTDMCHTFLDDIVGAIAAAAASRVAHSFQDLKK